MTAKVNLAPEIYQASQRNKQRRRLATSVGIIVNAVAVGLIVLALVVIGGQKIAIAVLQGQINSRQDQVKTYADLPAAVTAQQHLTSLGQLASKKVYFSRFFSVLQGIAPQGIAATNVTVGTDNTLEMTGTAHTYDLVTKLAKALQADNLTVGSNASPTQQPYFTNVSVASVSADTANGGVDFKLDTQMSSGVTNNGQ
jgi:Tfp pilus assembly protein PilN